MKVLGISGSLRAASINSALVRAAARLAPGDIEFAIFHGVGDLPLFNPDLMEHVPPAVGALYAAVDSADALVFASPEYAHGVTGAIKNLLDWLVGLEQFAGKPVAVLNAAPRAHHADAALRETLRTMAAVIVDGASLSIPLLGARLDDDGMVSNPVVRAVVQRCLAELQAAVSGSNPSQGPSFTPL